MPAAAELLRGPQEALGPNRSTDVAAVARRDPPRRGFGGVAQFEPADHERGGDIFNQLDFLTLICHSFGKTKHKSQ